MGELFSFVPVIMSFPLLLIIIAIFFLIIRWWRKRKENHIVISPSEENHLPRISLRRAPRGVEIMINPPPLKTLRDTASVQLMSVIPSIFFAVMSIFATDGVGSQMGVITGMFVYSLFLLPLSLFLAGMVGRLLLIGNPSGTRTQAAWIVTRLPYLNGVGFLMSVILLLTLCGGVFACR